MYLFKYCLLVNSILYLETGAVPALLVTLSREFHMGQMQQGLMGGIGESGILPLISPGALFIAFARASILASSHISPSSFHQFTCFCRWAAP